MSFEGCSIWGSRLGSLARVVFVLAILGFSPGCGRGSDIAKRQVLIEMRDGAELFTTIYRRHSIEANAPIILVRTNFGSHPYGVDEIPQWIPPAPFYLEEGYIVVIQDVRGTFMSQGQWRMMNLFEKNEGGASEATDTWDTVEWLVNNVPGNNGRVCLWGGSFNGTYALAGLVDKHPAVVCSVPQGPSTDWWGDDVFHNGALQLAHVFWGFAEFGPEKEEPSPASNAMHIGPESENGFDFFLNEIGGLTNVNRKYFHSRSRGWNDLVAHPARTQFWRKRNLHNYLMQSNAAVLLVGGWFDAEDLYGALETYRTLSRSGGEKEGKLVFVMGPWEHVQWMDGDSRTVGDITYPGASPQAYRARFQKRFLDYHLKTNAWAAPVAFPPINIYDTGRLAWREFDSWPPEAHGTCTLQITGKEQLSWNSTYEDTSGEIAFVSDPANPVPSWESAGFGMDPHYMNADQRFVAARPDVVTFVSDPLEAPVTMAGPLEVSLSVKTSGRDADWVVKIIDLFPGGEGLPETDAAAGFEASYQLLVRGDIFRGRYREGFEQTVPFAPGSPAIIGFVLNDVLHTFRVGHRIMVQVQSTWFPLFDRNPQNWVDNIFLAESDDFSPHTHTLLFGKNTPSRIVFPVMGDCPR